MKTVVHVVVVVVVVLVLVLGLNGAITKISAGREVAAQQIHKATPDSVILAEYARELSKMGSRNAEAKVDLDDLRHEFQRCVDRSRQLERELAEHRQALVRERALLETDQQEFLLGGQRVSRQRVEQDIHSRIRVCQALGMKLEASQEESMAHQALLGELEGQIAKTTQEYNEKLTEFDGLKIRLHTAKVQEGLVARLNSLSGLGSESSNLARISKEIQKRIARSRAGSEAFASDPASGLLNLGSESGPSAMEAADAYLQRTSQSPGMQSGPIHQGPLSGLIEVTD